ncbi:MAG: hypothetical protein NXI25_25705 [bacterium]|nr:hypothetical protein [bacterium]
MALVSDLKYGVWCCLCFLLACSSEDTAFQDFTPGEPGFATSAYFIDATLNLSGGPATTEHIALYADLDPDTPEGRNEFRVIESGATTEVYSVFFNDSTLIDTNFQDEAVFNNADLLYGSASYRGVGFCFYLPAPDASSSLSLELEDLLQPGQTLSLGQAPGMVEIGYFKNHPTAADRADRGLVTTAAESASGSLDILKVSEVQSGFGEAGYQIEIAFTAPLEHQLGLYEGGVMTGQGRIFVPKR